MEASYQDVFSFAIFIIMIIVILGFIVGGFDWIINQFQQPFPPEKTNFPEPPRLTVAKKATPKPALKAKPTVKKLTFLEFTEQVKLDHYFMDPDSDLFGNYPMEEEYKKVLDKIFSDLEKAKFKTV